LYQAHLRRRNHIESKFLVLTSIKVTYIGTDAITKNEHGMINLIIIGVGDLAAKLVPAAKNLIDRNEVQNLFFVDIKPIKEIIQTVKMKAKNFDSWFRKQESHLILQDSPKNSTADKIKSLTNKSDLKTVMYLATPPSAYNSSVIKYNGIADVFVLEKPWGDNLSDIERTIKSAGDKTIIGVDHYLWKESVRLFLKDENNRNKLDSHNFDFVISETLPEKTRRYYWDYGEVADMMPHVLPLLDKLRLADVSMLDTAKLKFRCGVWNPEDSAYIDKNWETVINKETFAEFELVSENKIIHIVLGKGTRFCFNEKNDESKFFSNDNELLINFHERNDSEHDAAYNNMFIHISENIEKIADREFEGFLNGTHMKRYVEKLDQLQKRIDKLYGITERGIKRSEGIKGLPNLLYCKNKNIRLLYHKDNKCSISPQD
jgi:hypothetical protein